VADPIEPDPEGGLPDFHPPINPVDRQTQEHIELYKISEAAIFNLLVAEKGGIAPYRYLDITNGDGAIIGNKDIGTAAWACIYLGKVLEEDSRPLIWINKAVTKLRELADYLLTQQCGSPTEDILITNTIGTSGPGDTEYGGFPRLVDNPVTLLANIFSEDLGICGLALLKAYQQLGDIKYKNGYMAAATCLRRMQQGGKLNIDYAAQTASGGRYHSGMWAHTMKITDELGQGGGAQGQGGAYGILLHPYGNIANDQAITPSITLSGGAWNFWPIDFASLPGTQMRIIMHMRTYNTGSARTEQWHLLLYDMPTGNFSSLIHIDSAATVPTNFRGEVTMTKPTAEGQMLILSHVTPFFTGGDTVVLVQNATSIYLELF
jgi:hypothetical protein